MLTRFLFSRTARALGLTFRGNAMLIEPRRFRSGSMGWRHSGEVIEVIGGVPCRAIFTLQVTIRGSKHWPEIEETAEEPVELAWAEDNDVDPLPRSGPLAWGDD